MLHIFHTRLNSSIQFLFEVIVAVVQVNLLTFAVLSFFFLSVSTLFLEVVVVDGDDDDWVNILYNIPMSYFLCNYLLKFTAYWLGPHHHKHTYTACIVIHRLSMVPYIADAYIHATNIIQSNFCIFILVYYYNENSCWELQSRWNTHTHTRKHTYIHLYQPWFFLYVCIRSQFLRR